MLWSNDTSWFLFPRVGVAKIPSLAWFMVLKVRLLVFRSAYHWCGQARCVGFRARTSLVEAAGLCIRRVKALNPRVYGLCQMGCFGFGSRSFLLYFYGSEQSGGGLCWAH